MSDAGFAVNKHIKSLGSRYGNHIDQTKNFASEKNECFYNLVCAILEQAVIDWHFLDDGKKLSERVDAQYVYLAEVEKFFMSEWFDELLSYALPQYTPQEIREALNVREPMRKEVRKNDQTRKGTR